MAITPRPLEDLSDSGILWLINKSCFHARGFAFALHYDKDRRCVGWSIIGDGTEPWTMGTTIDEDEKFAAAEATLQAARDAGG